MSSPKQKAYLANIFFSHMMSSQVLNYAYLSLQTHQLSAISAVIGNMFTIVKLQFKVTLCAHVKKTISPGKGSNSKILFQRKKAVLFQMK